MPVRGRISARRSFHPDRLACIRQTARGPAALDLGTLPALSAQAQV